MLVLGLWIMAEVPGEISLFLNTTGHTLTDEGSPRQGLCCGKGHCSWLVPWLVLKTVTFEAEYAQGLLVAEIKSRFPIPRMRDKSV